MNVLWNNKYLWFIGWVYFIFIYTYVHKSPYLCLCGDDRVTCYPVVDDVSGEPGEA